MRHDSLPGALRCFLHILKSRVVEKRVGRNRRQPRLYHRPVGDRGAESHTAVHVAARQQRKNHAGYSQVPEVDVVPQTVVVDFKQSVLIGYVSARTNNNNGDNDSQTDRKTKLPANTGCSEDRGHALRSANDGEVGPAGLTKQTGRVTGRENLPPYLRSDLCGKCI